jgi:peptidoglycan/xylan/chitin deacetylase (PgdA/CDA1 family)
MLSGSQLLRTVARWTPGGVLRPFARPVMLVFHGVTRRIEDPRIEVNHHTVDAFAALAKILSLHFDVLPLAALDDVLKNPTRHRNAVFLSSDDGYLNTLTNGADILDSLRLPWSLFVSTHHVDTGEPNPLFLARLFLYFAPDGTYRLPHLPEVVTLGAKRRGAVAFVITRFLRSLEAGKAREAVAAMMAVFAESELRALIERFPSERFLDWSQVSQLAARGVEIGAHAHEHWPMSAAQTPDYVQQQAKIAHDAVAAHVGQCRYFAYPFGNIGDVSSAAWQAVRDNGYRHAFTTMSATLDAGANPWLLPRYSLMLKEPNLRALLPMLRAGNARLVRWQHRLSV